MSATRGVSVQLMAALATALALIPVAVFLIGRGTPSVVLALVNVVLIAGCLYYLFSPAESHHEPAAG